MDFKEFTEYPNPESKNYDINSSIQNKNSKTTEQSKINKYEGLFTELYLELGCPEDFELEPFGITYEEFTKPTKETIDKLKKYAEHVKLNNRKYR